MSVAEMSPANRRKMETMGGVPIAIVREAFERSGHNYYSLALAMNWTCPPSRARPSNNRRADTSRVKRNLGIIKDNSTERVPRQWMHYDMAVRMITAMGLDPVDAGL